MSPRTRRFGRKVGRPRRKVPVSNNATANDAGPIPMCDEIPHLFSGQDLFAALLTLREAPVSTHDPLVRPCERADAHSKPHHVCLTCRKRATNYVRTAVPRLMKGKWLPLCLECGEEAMKLIPRNELATQRCGVGMRCRCDERWLCWECKIEALELASLRRDVEGERRRAPIGTVDAHGCVRIGMRCLCMGEVQPGAQTFMCAGCEAVLEESGCS